MSDMSSQKGASLVKAQGKPNVALLIGTWSLEMLTSQASNQCAVPATYRWEPKADRMKTTLATDLTLHHTLSCI